MSKNNHAENIYSYRGNGCHFSTLNDVIQYNAEHDPDKVIYNSITFADEDERCEDKLTNLELDRRVRNLAVILQKFNLEGERALLLYPPGLDYLCAFYACLYSGIIAVPAYPPFSERLARRLSSIIKDSGSKVILATDDILFLVKPLMENIEEMTFIEWISTSNLGSDPLNDYKRPDINGDTVAFLQYTSGSTSNPKGVILTHENVLDNLSSLEKNCHYTPESRCFMWLPQYHDMGLIGAVLQAMYTNFFIGFMSPLDFLQNPYRWLKGMSDFKATMSGGPNFAYDLAVKRITDEERATLDLSNWEIAANGGEPVRAETIDRFVETFGPCGFRRETFSPGYGLAESTFYMTSVPIGKSPRIIHLDASSLEQNKIKKVFGETPNCRSLVSNGPVGLSCRVIIVNPDSLCKCPENEVGEIWTSSNSVGLGYWGRKEESEPIFKAFTKDSHEGPFLRTGDLGFIYDGELFITGRQKDLIIIRGRNHYPQDIEKTVEESHNALRKGCSAVFSIESNDEEKLVVVQEIKKQSVAMGVPLVDVLSSIRRSVIANHDVTPDDIVLIKAGTIQKTSSGKIQRQLTKSKYLKKAFDLVISQKS